MVKEIKLDYTPQQLEVFFGDVAKFNIIAKGRRFGATKGAANACIEWAASGEKILWGDTINGNIDRYFDRYMLPELKKNNIEHKYNRQSKQLLIHDGWVDFRSADNPENWEGFGYDKIILNEAGIILKNIYLYTNAVLPMMMDNAESKLFALGVPKGKALKSHDEHPFYTLAKSAINKQPGYRFMEYSSYNNPLLTKQDIELLEDEIKRMNPAMVDQEIYGKFVDGAALTLWTPELIKHINHVPNLKKIVVAVDPTGSKQGDEVGIVTCGIDDKNDIYILTDLTGNYTPNEWGTIVSNEHEHVKADSVVAERNFGGDMVKAIILNINRNIRIKEVIATRGKDIRAEPVVGLYEQGKVYHASGLHKLENEMLTWVPGQGKSPNRVDALVWGITELTKDNYKQVRKMRVL